MNLGLPRKLFLCALIGLATWSGTMFGQARNDPWAPSSSYNPAIPTVESVLGYKVGDKFTAYSNLERYYQAVAAASDRMKIESYGKTYEGRKQYLITISAPKNLARLNEIRSAMAKLNDPRQTTPAEAQAIAEKNPIVVWLGYGVHGNEANSAEAAMQVVYELTASQDPRVQDWLENCVVLIDPLTNPDGHERYVQFYNSVAGEHPVADRFAAEQQERWPSGRSNHYYFDLNRDWAWQSQQETRNRLKVYLEWHPQVAADLHEMGTRSTYFFAPPSEPFYDPLRTNLAKWYDIFGKGTAAAFDRYGFRYYTHEGYDLFAPTYGDSWPALNGAIGMTYEMAGGGAGLAVNLDDDERTLTLRDRAVRHFTSSLATIDTAVKHRVDRLRSFYDFHQAAITAGQQSKSRDIFLVPGNDASRISHLVSILLGQGIEVQRLDSPVSIDDASGYWPDKVSDKVSDKRQVPAGTYVVDLAQPAGFLAEAILEREAHLTTSDTYDITGWTLPLAMDIEAYAGHAAGVHAVAVTEAPKPEGSVSGPQQASAYLVDWGQGTAAVLVNHLLQEGFKAYVTMQPFKEGGRQFSPGTVIVPVETNPATLDARIRQLAQRDGCRVEAVSSQLNESGVDLGSPQVRFLRKPRIAVVMDTPINSNDYGAIWHLFEQRLDIPFTPIRAESFNGVDLHQYNVIILAGEAQLDPKRMEEWVKAGGVLIGIRGGAIYATKKKSGLTSVTYKFLQRGPEEARIEQERAAKKDDNAKPDDAPPPPTADEKKKEQEAKLARKLMKYADREKQERDSQVPGTIMRTEVDNTHPLGFGLGDRLAVLDRTSPVLELTEKGENPVYFPKDGIKLSGYISAENEKKLAQTAYVVRERNGRGYVVLFADSPVFRGFWDGSARLLINAVFFGDVSDPRLP